MLDGWHKSYNVHALHTLIKPVEFPVAALGVGEDEKHKSVNGVVKYPSPLQRVALQPALNEAGYEYTQLDGEAIALTGNDFPSTYYMGDIISNYGLQGGVK